MFHLNQNVFLTKGLRRATLFDGNSGAVYWLSPAASGYLAEMLRNQRNDTLSPDRESLLSDLCAFGLGEYPHPDNAVPNREQSTNPVQHSMSMVYYEITTACNMSCLHCYAGCAAGEPQATIPSLRSTEDDRNLFKAIADSGIRRIQFIGGEPFLYWDRLERLCCLAAQYFGQVEIASNGTLMNDGMISFIKANDIKLSISLYSHRASTHDGITRRPGSHALTMATLRRLKEADIDFYIAYVSMDRNISHMDATIDYIWRHFAKKVKPKPLRLTGRAALGFLDKDGLEKRHITLSNFTGTFELEDFLLNMHFHNCYGRGMYIGCDGTVYPCVMERRFAIGDINQDDWGGILAGRAFHDAIRITKDKIDGCRDCEFRYLCFDCRPDASALNPNFLGKPWNCTYSPRDGRWEGPQKQGNEAPITRLTREIPA